VWSEGNGHLPEGRGDPVLDLQERAWIGRKEMVKLTQQLLERTGSLCRWGRWGVVEGRWDRLGRWGVVEGRRLGRWGCGGVLESCHGPGGRRVWLQGEGQGREGGTTKDDGLGDVRRGVEQDWLRYASAGDADDMLTDDRECPTRVRCP
jgi:hypothetical protein